MQPIRAVMLSVNGVVLTETEKKLFEQSNPLGVTLFKRNIADKAQLKTLIQSIKEVIGRQDVLIAIDQEGGRVQRLNYPAWWKYASEYALGSLPQAKAAQAVYLHGKLIGSDLAEVGINVNYAPVLDIRYADTTPALASRTFSENQKKVALLGQTLITAFHEQAVCACIKHLPGHGRAAVDPHFHLPIVTQSVKELEKDFYPFIAVANQALAGMTGHILFQQIDNKPVTQSAKLIQEIIRQHIGFNGFLFSDAIDMHALTGSLQEKTKTCLDAGCDAVCYCKGDADEIQQVINAARPLTDEALYRFEKIKNIFSNTKDQINENGKKLLYDSYVKLTLKAKNPTHDYDAVEVLHQPEKSDLFFKTNFACHSNTGR